ncbi:hypothetical protein SFRURICE_017064, partial [Spodoptera frugiperda]
NGSEFGALIGRFIQAGQSERRTSSRFDFKLVLRWEPAWLRIRDAAGAGACCMDLDSDYAPSGPMVRVDTCSIQQLRLL